MILITLIAVIIYLCIHFTEKKYTAFIVQNSVALKKLKAINGHYRFYPYINFNQEYTYDNERYYETISCSDFLIYQLQYLEPKITTQIENIKGNKKRYQSYKDELNGLQLGDFQAPIRRLKLNKLLKKEKSILEKNTYSPPVMQFSLTVTLYCSKINGRVYAWKVEDFSVDEINVLIKRVRNKKGTFYNDRGVWDAICRVERGKVSNKMRFSIYERDGYKCCRCGISERYAILEIDHIIPISKGGKSTYDNLQTLCHKCNYEKGNKF